MTAYATTVRRYPQIRTELALTGSVAVFAGIGVWTELRYATGPQPPAFGAYLLTLGAAASLLFRQSRPLAAAAGCLLFCLAYRMVGYPGFAPAVLIFIACYSLAAYRHLAYGLAAAAAGWIIPALPPHALPLLSFPVSMPPIGMAATAVLGEAARRRRIDHEEQVRQSASTAEAQLGRRMAEERLRIARELHDVLAHTISVVAVQSSVALDVLDDSPEQAREALLAVRGAARQAMPELRAALDLLRGSSTPTGRPQPGLGQLPELVQQIRDSGLTVELAIDDSAAGASTLLQLTAYRIVQESLTNVLRHASASSATVAIRREPDALAVEVVDDGRGGADVHANAPMNAPMNATVNASASALANNPGGTDAPLGFGLMGMRERASALGGDLLAAPRPEGGFRVLARLPWETP